MRRDGSVPGDVKLIRLMKGNELLHPTPPEQRQYKDNPVRKTTHSARAACIARRARTVLVHADDRQPLWCRF
jgi:hypothetical protein